MLALSQIKTLPALSTVIALTVLSIAALPTPSALPGAVPLALPQPASVLTELGGHDSGDEVMLDEAARLTLILREAAREPLVERVTDLEAETERDGREPDTLPLGERETLPLRERVADSVRLGVEPRLAKALRVSDTDSDCGAVGASSAASAQKSSSARCISAPREEPCERGAARRGRGRRR